MAKPQILLRGPRYLRAIPSLVLLTTAMAWSAASDLDVVDASGKKAGVSLSQHAGSAGVDGLNFYVKQGPDPHT